MGGVEWIPSWASELRDGRADRTAARDRHEMKAQAGNGGRPASSGHEAGFEVHGGA
jgi:hypothetical protein